MTSATEMTEMKMIVTFAILSIISSFASLCSAETFNLTTKASAVCLNFTKVDFPSNDLRRRSVIFTVDPLSDAWIRLGATTSYSIDDYVVVITGINYRNHSIGFYPNSFMSNVTNTQNSPFAYSSSSSSSSSYWISWENRIVMVGSGSVVGTDPFIVMNDSRAVGPSAVEDIGVCSPSDNTFWSFQYSINDSASVPSDNSSSPNSVPQSGHRLIATRNGCNCFNDTAADVSAFDWITFGVASCCPAHIALTSGGFQQGERGYEVILGEENNTASFIGDQLQSSPYAVYYRTPAVLSCASFGWFWISWTADGLVSVGTGSTRDVGVFMVWRTKLYPPLTVSKLGISTFSCAVGYWAIPLIYFPSTTSNLPSSTTVANATEFANASELSATTTIGLASATVNLTQGTGSDSYPKTTLSAGAFYWINSNRSSRNNNTTSQADSTTTAAVHGLNLSTVLNLTTLVASTATALNRTTAANNAASSLGLNSESMNETTTVPLTANASESTNVIGWTLIQSQSSDNYETVVHAYTAAPTNLPANNSQSSLSESIGNYPLLYENSSLVTDTNTISSKPLLNSTTTNSSSSSSSSSSSFLLLSTTLKSASWTEWNTEETPADVLTADFIWNPQTQNPNNVQVANVSHEVHITPNDLTKVCLPPPPADNATLVFNDNLTYGQVAVYTCLPGYTFVFGGSSRSIICINGSWHASVKGCRPVPCSYFSLQSQSPVSLSFMDFAVAVCSNGRRMQNGNTTGTARCSSSHTGSSGILSKPFYQACSMSLCPSIPEVTAAYVLYGRWPNLLTFICYPGYRLLSGAKVQSLVCTDGIWSIPQPCRVVLCDALPRMSNVQLSTNATEYGTRVNVTCQPGTGRTSGILSTVVQCLDSGLWNDSIQPCYELNCPDYLVPNDSEVVGLITKPFVFGTKILLSCIDGRRFETGFWYKAIYCQSNGQWTAMEFTCQYNRCPPVPEMMFGEANTTLALNGTAVSYTCPDGYSPPSRPLVCNGSDWNLDPTMSLCQVFICQELPMVGHGSCLRISSENYPSPIAKLICDDGYQVNGQKTMNLTCVENQKWSPEVVSCSPVDCGPPPPISGASILPYSSTLYPASVTYVCEGGSFFRRETFTLGLQCTSNATWQNIQNQGCTEITCPRLLWHVVSRDSVSVSTLVNISCPIGQIFQNGQNEMIAVCDEYGRWSPEIPDCVDRVKLIIQRSVGLQPKMLAIPSARIQAAECPEPHLVYLPALIVITVMCCLSLGFDLYHPCKKKCQAKKNSVQCESTKVEAK